MSEGFISRPGTNLVATLRDGWRAKFMGETAYLTHPLHEPYSIRLDQIRKGDVLPPESHFDGDVNA